MPTILENSVSRKLSTCARYRGSRFMSSSIPSVYNNTSLPCRTYPALLFTYIGTGGSHSFTRLDSRLAILFGVISRGLPMDLCVSAFTLFACLFMRVSFPELEPCPQCARGTQATGVALALWALVLLRRLRRAQAQGLGPRTVHGCWRLCGVDRVCDPGPEAPDCRVDVAWSYESA